MRLIRIWFEKVGEVKYISHLDLMRLFTRAVRRAEIPLWYTEGYNPRAYMQFALPLSLGMESLCESVDIRIEGDITDEEIFRRLSSAMPKGVNLKSIKEAVHNPKYIAYGDFDIIFSGTDRLSQLKELIDKCLCEKSLIVQKLGKKGHKKVMKEINLSDYIENPVVTQSKDSITVALRLPAGCTTNINPSLFSDKVLEYFGEDTAVSIVRKALVLENGEIFR